MKRKRAPSKAKAKADDDVIENDNNPSINKSLIEESQSVLSIHQYFNKECIELVKENKENRNELCIK